LEAAPDGRARVRLGLIATPALDAGTVEELAAELTELLAQRFPGVEWEVTGVRSGLLQPPVPMTEIVDAARRSLLERDWDLVVAVTELPLRLGRRPLIKHASPTHRVGLVSLPALGARRVRGRLLESLSDVVAALVNDGSESEGTRRRLAEIVNDVERSDELGVVYLARVVSGNLQLLLGMVRANHPWRFATRLTRALFGAIAAASFALVMLDVWRIANSLEPLRLAALTVASLGAASVTMITVHDLWERTNAAGVREQVTLFNVVTAITVTFGVASLYVALFAVSLLGAALLIDKSLFQATVSHSVGLGDYLRLVWLTASVAMVGGALGGALESDQAVREAAYAYRGEEGEEVALNDTGGLATDL
jgi:hypothetical protein